jgi:hypothetical protein
VRHRDEVLDRHGIEHLPAEAFGDDAGADALARGIDRRRRAGGPPPTTSTSNGSLAAIFSAARAAEPVSSLATICARSMRPDPNGSPLRNTVGTAMILRRSTSSWNTRRRSRRASRSG